MVSSGLLRRVALVRTDVSEEPDISFIRVAKIGELGTTQAATSNRRTLRFHFFAACVGYISEYCILHSHRRDNLKSYKKHTVRTSQETRYVSAIESSRLMLYNI
jgi:hypothetical protein